MVCHILYGYGFDAKIRLMDDRKVLVLSEMVFPMFREVSYFPERVRNGPSCHEFLVFVIISRYLYLYEKS